MNRIVLFGLTGFFALVGICLIDGSKPAKAFHGWPMCGCWSCQGWQPWHAGQRCYSNHGCSGCQGCYASVGHCCASSTCHGCYGYQRCYGCYGGCGCQGAAAHSCYGCYGGCSGCGGYYQSVAPPVVWPVEPAPAVSPPASSPSGKATLQMGPSAEGEFVYFMDENALALGEYVAEGAATDNYIHEPR